MADAPAAAVVAGEPRASSPDIGDLYVEYRELLLHISCRKFRVPEQDAENLMQEVFLSYLESGSAVTNTRGWLVGAMCNASRHYWRVQSRTESLPDDYGDQGDPKTNGLADTFATTLTLRQAMRYLQPRCRETLYLHYFEGRSASDVAKEMDTTNRYAEKLIHNCLKRVREIYFSITALRKR